MSCRFIRDFAADHVQQSWCAEHVAVDFEAAAIRAWIEVFGGTAIAGCYFHFINCNQRRIKSLGQWAMYKNDQYFRTVVKLTLSLAFLPNTEVDQKHNSWNHAVLNRVFQLF